MGNLVNKLKWKCALVVLPLCVAWHAADAAVAVIANSDFPVDKLTSAQVSKIFLGKMSALPDGTVITVIEHKDGEAVKDEFYDKVVGKTASQLKAYWAKLIFTGEGVPPKAYSGDQAVTNPVSATPGAIGYVDAGAVDKSVKVLLERK